jgi:transcription antitermination factor NusG
MPEEKAGYDWFVFRASYSREEKASELIERLNAPAYVARHTVYTRTKTGVKSQVKILIPNLVFAYLSHQEAELFVKGPTLKDLQFQRRTEEEKKNILKLTQILSYYYNHFKLAGGKNPPLTIPYKDMEKFIIATSSEKDVMPIDEREFEIGEEVQVVMGEFMGLRGRVMRRQARTKKLLVQLHDNVPLLPAQGGAKRLCFQLPCLGSFCSALIPSAYFRKVD